MVVRREKVVLELEDRFTGGVTRAAAAVSLLRGEVDGLSKDAVQAQRTTRQIEREVDTLGKTSRRSEKDIDRLSGRLRIFADIVASLGPAAAPIGAVAVPAITGLASQLGFAVIGVGVAVTAFQGIGDTLEVVNKAALEPTVENLQAAKDALADLSPEARRFVGQLQELRPELQQLRDAAAKGLLPGLGDGLEDLETALPRVEAVISAIATELGEIASDVGGSIASGRWDDFLDFVADEAPDALSDLTTAAGNTVHGLANLWMAFDPLNDDFSTWLVRVTGEFDDWSDRLERTEDLQEFFDYIRTNGPQVGDTLGSVGNALLQIVEAAAPLGGPILRILETLADTIAAVADSDLGTPIFGMVAAMGALNTAVRIYQGLQKAAFGGTAIAAILANEAALARFGMTTKTAGAGLASLKQGAGVAAVIVAIGAALHTLEKDDPTEPVDRFVASLKDIKSGAPGAKKAINDLFDTTGSAWSVLTSGSVAEINNIQDAVEALDRGWFSKFGQWASKGFGVWSTEADLATSAFEKSDAALGQLVAEGKIDAARTAFSYLADEASRAGMPIDELRKLFPEYTKAMDYATEHQDDFNRAQKEMEAEQARADIREIAAEFTDLGDTVEDTTITLDTWIQKLNIQAKALNEFTENAVTAARRGVEEGLIAKFRELGPAGAEMLQKLADGTDAQIAQANRAFRRQLIAAKRAQEALAGSLKPIPLEADADPAKREILDLQGMLSLLVSQPRTIGVNVKVNVPEGYDQNLGSLLLGPLQSGKKKGSAAGSTVPKTGLPYADRHPYLLADGEEVVSNSHGQADRHRPLLKAINADRRLAAGGTAGGLRGWLSGGDPWTSVMAAMARAFGSIPDSLDDWRNALTRSERAIDKEREKRDELVDLRNSLIADVAGKLRSDLFTSDRTSSVWMSDKDRAKAGLGDVFSILQGDIANSGALGKALKQLTRKGLSGAAFAEVAQNADLAQAQALAGMSARDVRRFEWLYKRRQQVSGAVGQYAGQATYGRQIAEQTKYLGTLVESNRRIGARLARLEALAETNPAAVGKAVGTAVNGAAPRRRA